MSYTPFDAIKIGIASPEMILSWSSGEVSSKADFLRPARMSSCRSSAAFCKTRQPTG